MDSTMNPRRKFLFQAIVSMTQEAGFDRVDRYVLETLLEMFQSLLLEVGRTTQLFTELAGRVEPNVGDVTMAFVYLGLKLDPVGLRTFMRRHGRVVIANPQGLPPVKNPTILSVGKRRSLPSYVPDYFPPMPDPHTYIRTPTHRQPITDYAACREKISQQKRDLERSLAKFYARTLQCSFLFPENQSLFPFITPKPVSYFDHLIPRDQIFEDDENLPRINFVKKVNLNEDNAPKLNDDDEESDPLDTSNVNAITVVEDTWELIDNPYLKPVRQLKKPSVKKLSSS